jgi:hypothetical protein
MTGDTGGASDSMRGAISGDGARGREGVRSTRGFGLSRGARSMRGLRCAALVLLVAACGGARHRKVNGPPPEYESPDDLGYVDGGSAAPDGTSGGAGTLGPTSAARTPEAGAR